MNQILSTNNNNGSRNPREVDTQKIIKIFCVSAIAIAVIIIAIICIGKFIKSKEEKVELKKPIISIKREEQDFIMFFVTCADGLSKIEYTWNNTDTTEINCNGATDYSRKIELPEGAENYLDIYATSSNNVTERAYQTFAEFIDLEKPKIEYGSTIEDSMITVTATDETKLSYMEYYWDGEDSVKVDVTEDSPTKIETKIEVLRGTRKLYVKAVDLAGNTENVSRLITGVNQPEITAIRYGGVVNVKAYHDMGFKRIEYIINNQLYVYDENFSRYNPEEKEVELEFPLKEGENTVVIKAYSLEKYEELTMDNLDNYASKIFRGKCTYQPEN